MREWLYRKLLQVPDLQMAGSTRLELATSCVTGRRSNQTELRPRVSSHFFCSPTARDVGCFLSPLRGLLMMVGGTGFEPVTPCL